VLGAALGLALFGPGHAAAATAFTRDRAGRILVGLQLDGRGPFRFLLDTGAEISAVSAFLARELRLAAVGDGIGTSNGNGEATSPQQRRPLLGSTGSAPLVTVGARNLTVDRWQVANPVFALLPGSAGGDDDMDGVLGGDLMQGARLDVSFANASVVIESVANADAGRASTVGAARGTEPLRLIDVAIERRLGPLLALRGSFRIAPPVRAGTPRRAAPRRDVTVGAILDTGAQRSIGNSALAQALQLDPAAAVEAMVRGAGGQVLAALQLETPALALGAASLPARPLLYADLPAFAAWGWSRRPAVLLGMDLLSRLARLEVDYRRRRVALTVDAS